jgi:hypothetical protein
VRSVLRLGSGGGVARGEFQSTILIGKATREGGGTLLLIHRFGQHAFQAKVV